MWTKLKFRARSQAWSEDAEQHARSEWFAILNGRDSCGLRLRHGAGRRHGRAALRLRLGRHRRRQAVLRSLLSSRNRATYRLGQQLRAHRLSYRRAHRGCGGQPPWPQKSVAACGAAVCAFLHPHRVGYGLLPVHRVAHRWRNGHRPCLQHFPALYRRNQPRGVARPACQPQSAGYRLRHSGGANRQLAHRGKGSRRRGRPAAILERAIRLALDVYGGRGSGNSVFSVCAFHSREPALACRRESRG